MRPAALEAEVLARQKELKEQMSGWLARGACKAFPELNFTPEWSENVTEYEEQLKSICSACPVELTCREHAIKFPECAGVWGGMTEKERRALQDE